MAEAVLAAGHAESATIIGYFEVHVLRDERWTIDGTSQRAEEALEIAQDLARHADVLGVKVIHERYNPATDQSAARVVFSAIKPPRPKPRRVAPRIAAPAARMPAGADPAAPAPLEPPPQPVSPQGGGAPGREPSSFMLFAWASLALALTATLLFVLLLFVG